MRGREQEKIFLWERDLSEQRSRDRRRATGARHFNRGILIENMITQSSMIYTGIMIGLSADLAAGLSREQATPNPLTPNTHPPADSSRTASSLFAPWPTLLLPNPAGFSWRSFPFRLRPQNARGRSHCKALLLALPLRHWSPTLNPLLTPSSLSTTVSLFLNPGYLLRFILVLARLEKDGSVRARPGARLARRSAPP